MQWKIGIRRLLIKDIDREARKEHWNFISVICILNFLVNQMGIIHCPVSLLDDEQDNLEDEAW